jgi:hypothetical protein
MFFELLTLFKRKVPKNSEPGGDNVREKIKASPSGARNCGNFSTREENS